MLGTTSLTDQLIGMSAAEAAEYRHARTEKLWNVLASVGYIGVTVALLVFGFMVTPPGA